MILLLWLGHVQLLSLWRLGCHTARRFRANCFGQPGATHVLTRGCTFRSFRRAFALPTARSNSIGIFMGFVASPWSKFGNFARACHRTGLTGFLQQAWSSMQAPQPKNESQNTRKLPTSSWAPRRFMRASSRNSRNSRPASHLSAFAISYPTR